MFVAPMLIGGRDSRAAVEADGVALVADAPRALATDRRDDRPGRADHRTPEGVVAVFTGLVAALGHGHAESGSRHDDRGGRAGR